MMQKIIIHVAVGVIVDANKRILISLRPDHVHQGGLWEFPGGKLETGESLQQALIRELSEELGLIATKIRPLIEIHHDYSDKSVLLDVCWVDQFEGLPEGKEGQAIRWVTAAELLQYAFPEANQPIIQAIQAALL